MSCGHKRMKCLTDPALGQVHPSIDALRTQASEVFEQTLMSQHSPPCVQTPWLRHLVHHSQQILHALQVCTFWCITQLCWAAHWNLLAALLQDLRRTALLRSLLQRTEEKAPVATPLHARHKPVGELTAFAVWPATFVHGHGSLCSCLELRSCMDNMCLVYGPHAS